MRIHLKRTATALVAGSLVLGAAACNQDDSPDTAPDTSSAAESGAADTSSASGSATEAPSGTELTEGLQAAYDEAGGEQGPWGAVKNVESSDGATLATFEHGWAVENGNGDVVPLIGKIGETWANDGGLDNEIGLPTAPETGDAMQGWTQDFENGTIAWMQDGSGSWNADIRPAQ
jgi:hypothetical protein